MNIYIFGNPDHPADNLAIKMAQKLDQSLPDITFTYINPNQDLPIPNNKYLVIMDAVQGIKKITILNQTNLDAISLSPRFSAHDYDLGFQLKYLKKIGKLNKFTLIALPYDQMPKLSQVTSAIAKLNNSDTPVL